MTLNELFKLKEKMQAATSRYLDQMEQSGWANSHIEREYVEATATFRDACHCYVDQLLQEKPKPHGTEVDIA